uniref:THAP domain-containing protein 3 isoform X4 n=1 Tax=Tursiops truncatus TaxID=9739 RepID=A0A2U4B0A8_TURTR|nr:THAP domain-containing protein 3 isoform X4 [Tursiops truncatus]
MPKSCAARQCCNRYSNRRKQLTFHRFPFSRPELLKEWVLNIGRGDFEPKQHTVICSEHFRPECFSAFGNRKNLKHNAVPTVFAFQGPPQMPWKQLMGEGAESSVLPWARGRRRPSLPHHTQTSSASCSLPARARGPVAEDLPPARSPLRSSCGCSAPARSPVRGAGGRCRRSAGGDGDSGAEAWRWRGFGCTQQQQQRLRLVGGRWGQLVTGVDRW